MRRFLLLAILGLGILPSVAAAQTSAGQLTGAGSTLVAPLVSRWAAAYGQQTGVQIDYQAIGSGGGIAEISARTVDFGASDAPLTPEQFSLAAGVVQVPWALSATSIPYNLPGLNGRLKLTGPLLAQIYLGKITQWDDPRIAAVNPGLNLPALAITPIYRSDASGTTFNFTDFLTQTSREWKTKIGNSTAVEFPAGLGAQHSSGVAQALRNTRGGIAYVEVAYSLTNDLHFAAIENNAHVFTLPAIRSIAAAAATVTKVPRGNALSIVNPPASDSSAYPISTFTYVILPLQTSRSGSLKKFVLWALTKGQGLGAPLYFAPVPQPVLVAAERTLRRISP